MTDKFIITFDEATTASLLKLGFVEMPSGNTKSHVFINNQTLKFDENIDMSKIKFSNMLCI